MIPAPLTITASSGTMTYGGAVPVVSPNVSGLQNGENVSVLGAGLTCTTGASRDHSVGTYATSCSGAVDANYTISYVGGTIDITPAALSITASSNSMTYGDAVPGSPRSSRASRTGRRHCARRRPHVHDRGGPSTRWALRQCVPVRSTPTTDHLLLRHRDGEPSHADDHRLVRDRRLRTSPPAITPAYSGFVNSDNATSLTTPPTCTTTATSSSPVGSYTSSCSGASDPNYTISYLNGSVQVATVVVTVTASSGTMTYGGSSRPSRPRTRAS